MKERKTIMEVGSDGVAVITLNDPPLNLLSYDVLVSLKDCTQLAIQRDDVKAVVLTGSNGKFSGGANVSAFGTVPREGNKVGLWSIDFLTDVFEAARKPIVAAVDGIALGGGLEVAMACHARISTSNAQLGLPELQFGILPGLGGTQRLPRLVGLSKALEMMLTSKIVKGEEAYSLGLVDAIAPTSELVNRARSWALCILEQKKPWISSLYKLDKLEPLAKVRVICTSARARAKKQSPNVEFPLACVDVIEEGIVSGPRAGLWKEAKTNEELQHSITSKSLVHIFFAQRATTKVPGVTDLGLQPKKIYKIAVVGGGLMGSGIATVLILHNYPVILKEVNEQFLQAGIGRVKANLQSHAKGGKMSLEKLDKTFSLLRGVLEYDSFRDVDLVIEAVTEDILLKQQIFADLEKYCPPNCVLASNTSTFDLNLVGKKTNVHSRIVGAHFFSPAHVRPLLEIIHTEQTSAQAVLDLIHLAKSIKKTAIIVKNSTGFATTRMMFPYSMAATFFVERGADIYKIDQAISKFGMPMGPFRMADLVGFGVATGARANMKKSFSERWYDSRLMQVMQEDGRAGQTTGKGFYVYDSNRKAFPDPEIEKYIEKTRRISGISIDTKLKSLSEKEIVEMLFFPVVNESCRILAEGIAIKASDLDVASVMGFGFPAYRGGIMFWADSIGPKYICSKLDEWSRIYSKIFEPSAYLKERASRDIPLGAPPEQASSRL